MKKLKDLGADGARKARELADKVKPSEGVATWLEAVFNAVVSTFVVFVMGFGVVHLVDLSILHGGFWPSLVVISIFGLFTALAQAAYRYFFKIRLYHSASKRRFTPHIHFLLVFILAYCVVYYLKVCRGIAI